MLFIVMATLRSWKWCKETTSKVNEVISLIIISQPIMMLWQQSVVYVNVIAVVLFQLQMLLAITISQMTYQLLDTSLYRVQSAPAYMHV